MPLPLMNISVLKAKEADEVLLENIVDSDGHKRFISGDITTTAHEGIAYTYAKWSLSGSHLMIVLCGSVASGKTITDGAVMGTLADVPSWIYNKISPIGIHYIIDVMTANLYSPDEWNRNTTIFRLRKPHSDSIVIDKDNNYLNERDYTQNFRIMFDILID